MAPPAVPIGIAVVELDGRFLVGIRGPDGPLAGHAEFPGGKCKADESPRDCAVRECLEETGLAVQPQQLLEVREFDYPSGRVELHFWLCRLVDAEGESAEHGGFRWVPRAKLQELDFPEANESVIEMLAAQSGGG